MVMFLVGLFGIAVSGAPGQDPTQRQSSQDAAELPTSHEAVDPQSPQGAASDTGEDLPMPTDGLLVAEIDGLITELGSPLFREREAGTMRLLEIGVPSFAQLSAGFRKTDDLEVRLRIERIVRDAYFDENLYNRNGFLGVSQAPVPIVPDDHPGIPEGRIGIRVLNVIPDTAAEQSGIERDDVIIALDGAPLPDEGLDTVTAFGELIRHRGPGAVMAVTILRGARRIEIAVTLGRRPTVYYGANQRVVYDMFQRCSREFRALWNGHFLKPDTDSSDNND